MSAQCWIKAKAAGAGQRVAVSPIRLCLFATKQATDIGEKETCFLLTAFYVWGDLLQIGFEGALKQVPSPDANFTGTSLFSVFHPSRHLSNSLTCKYPASLPRCTCRTPTSTAAYVLMLLFDAQFQPFTLNIVFRFPLRSVSNRRFRFANVEK